MRFDLLPTGLRRQLLEDPGGSRSRRPVTSAKTASDPVSCLRVVPVPPGLSRRERELRPCLATDLSYAAIARKLGYWTDNARLLAKRLLRKLVSSPAGCGRKPLGAANLL